MLFSVGYRRAFQVSLFQSLSSVMSGETGGHTIQQLTSNQSSTTATLPQYSVPAAQVSGASKYTQLLSVGCLLFFDFLNFKFVT